MTPELASAAYSHALTYRFLCPMCYPITTLWYRMDITNLMYPKSNFRFYSYKLLYFSFGNHIFPVVHPLKFVSYHLLLFITHDIDQWTRSTQTLKSIQNFVPSYHHHCYHLGPNHNHVSPVLQYSSVSFIQPLSTLVLPLSPYSLVTTLKLVWLFYDISHISSLLCPNVVLAFGVNMKKDGLHPLSMRILLPKCRECGQQAALSCHSLRIFLRCKSYLAHI